MILGASPLGSVAYGSMQFKILYIPSIDVYIPLLVNNNEFYSIEYVVDPLAGIYIDFNTTALTHLIVSRAISINTPSKPKLVLISDSLLAIGVVDKPNLVVGPPPTRRYMYDTQSLYRNIALDCTVKEHPIFVYMASHMLGAYVNTLAFRHLTRSSNVFVTYSSPHLLSVSNSSLRGKLDLVSSARSNTVASSRQVYTITPVRPMIQFTSSSRVYHFISPKER